MHEAKNVALSGVFHHPAIPLSPSGPSTRNLYLGLTGGLNSQTPFLNHFVPGLE